MNYKEQLSILAGQQPNPLLRSLPQVAALDGVHNAWSLLVDLWARQ